MIQLTVEPMTANAFAPYGEVIELSGDDFVLINNGRCRRYTGLAALVADGDGEIGLSLFHSEVQAMPYTCDLLERHPHGTQCFVPMEGAETLYVVAEDEGGIPVRPRAFRASSAQAVNLHKNTWHGVLTPLSGTGLYAVIDRVGGSPNLQEHPLSEPLLVVNNNVSGTV